MADTRRCEFEPGFYSLTEFYYDSDWGWIHGHKPANGKGSPSGPTPELPAHNVDGDVVTDKTQMQPRRAPGFVEWVKEQVVPSVGKV